MPGETLQWGHVFSDVEMPLRRVHSGAFTLLQWGHVFSDVEIPMMTAIGQQLIQLQWGHVFSDVEIKIWFFKPCKHMTMLQWGHVFSDVEINPLRKWNKLLCVASMGPRLFRRGNEADDGLRQFAFSTLQWGHVFSDVEMN